MGADLYIKSITDPAREKYEPRFHKAVAKRDSLIQECQKYESLVEKYKQMAEADMPFVQKHFKTANAKLEALKSKIEVAQEKVSHYFDLMNGRGGYFRDNYNASSVLWRLGLSWWQDVPGDGQPSVEQLRSFLAKVKSAKIKPVTEQELPENGCKVDNGEHSPAAWNKYFRNKKRQLVAFLERCIVHRQRGEEVYFSL